MNASQSNNGEVAVALADACLGLPKAALAGALERLQRANRAATRRHALRTPVSRDGGSSPSRGAGSDGQTEARFVITVHTLSGLRQAFPLLRAGTRPLPRVCLHKGRCCTEGGERVRRRYASRLAAGILCNGKWLGLMKGKL